MANSEDISCLPRVCFHEKQLLPDIAAVYFAVSATEQILYVGETINLRQRWFNHHRSDELTNLQCAWIVWEENRAFDLGIRERFWILSLQPSLNGTWTLGTRAKHEREAALTLEEKQRRDKEFADWLADTGPIRFVRGKSKDMLPSLGLPQLVRAKNNRVLKPLSQTTSLTWIST
jgi:GIY-YIG catalytic domain